MDDDDEACTGCYPLIGSGTAETLPGHIKNQLHEPQNLVAFEHNILFH